MSYESNSGEIGKLCIREDFIGMSVIEAKKNYIGQSGYKRMNCAQSVLSAFKGKYHLECSNIRALRKLSCVGCVEKSAEFLEKFC